MRPVVKPAAAEAWQAGWSVRSGGTVKRSLAVSSQGHCQAALDSATRWARSAAAPRVVVVAQRRCRAAGTQLCGPTLRSLPAEGRDLCRRLYYDTLRRRDLIYEAGCEAGGCRSLAGGMVGAFGSVVRLLDSFVASGSPKSVNTIYYKHCSVYPLSQIHRPLFGANFVRDPRVRRCAPPGAATDADAAQSVSGKEVAVFWQERSAGPDYLSGGRPRCSPADRACATGAKLARILKNDWTLSDLCSRLPPTAVGGSPLGGRNI